MKKITILLFTLIMIGCQSDHKTHTELPNVLDIVKPSSQNNHVVIDGDTMVVPEGYSTTITELQRLTELTDADEFVTIHPPNSTGVWKKFTASLLRSYINEIIYDSLAQHRIEIDAISVSGNNPISHDALSSGIVSAYVTRLGGSPTILSNPSAGEYTIHLGAGSNLIGTYVFGNNTVLNGANEFKLRLDNSDNLTDKWVSIQIYDVSTGGLVNPFSTGCNWAQSITGNITEIVFPGMNVFGTSGFRIVIK